MGGSQSLPNPYPCVRDQVVTVQKRPPEGAGIGAALTFIKDLVDAEASRPQLHLAQAPRASKAQTNQIVCSGLRRDYSSPTTHLGAVTRGLWFRPRARPFTPSPRFPCSKVPLPPRQGLEGGLAWGTGGCELHVLLGVWRVEPWS